MSFLKSPEFDAIYDKLPNTGTSSAVFAAFTADPESQKIFEPHFQKIELINCRDMDKAPSKSNSKNKLNISGNPSYSGPLALNLAQKGHKVAVLIFADSTNVGGIYMTGGCPAGTQEEQTVLMAPEVYGFLGNRFGVHDIGGNGDGIYKENQKRYCINKDEYEDPTIINPAYGFILTNLLMTHNANGGYSMVKLPKEKVVEVSYAFLSMPSFATGVSSDPVGAALIGQSELKNGEVIYQNMSEATSALTGHYDDKYWNEKRLDIGKVSLFYSVNELQNYSNNYLTEGRSIGKTIFKVVDSYYKLEHSKEKDKLKKELNIKDFSTFKKDTIRIVEEARKNYEKCLTQKFTNLIRGVEKSGADTLILGKIGCGAFMNNENEVAYFMGKSLSECENIKNIYIPGVRENDPFINNVKNAIGKK